jgi:BirA family biotin operon repressor/biotin-[acetyl-CoA-carboxylase] ligase
MVIHRPPFIIHHFTTLGSTNDHLKGMMDAPEFTCVVADEQTAGRGRRQRVWHSSPGDGLYLSALLRPRPESSSKIPLISLMAAIAVAEALIERGVAGVDIKWPNDVMARDRKISGILAEGASVGSNTARIILGIGVNLNHKSFPPELSRTSTSIAIETGDRVVVDEFRDQLLEKIRRWYEVWERDDGLIVNRWQQLSTYARGQRVVVALDDEQVVGMTAGLNESGALRLITDDGEMKVILAGEVMRLRIEDRGSRIED